MSADTKLGRKIGEGANSEVFAYGQNRVLKLLKADRSPSVLIQDAHYSLIANAHGLPAAKVWDRMEVNGRYGVVFDRIEGPTWEEQGLKIPPRPSKYARMLAQWLASIHSVDISGEEFHLPGSITQKGRIKEQIEMIGMWPEMKKARAIAAVDDLLDGSSLCHGDFYGGNIVMSGDGPVVMDWDTGSQGNPWGDVAASSALILSDNNPDTAPNWHRTVHRMIAKRINTVFLREYLAENPDTDNQLDEWLICAYAARIGVLSQEHFPAVPEKQTLMLSHIEEHSRLSE